MEYLETKGVPVIGYETNKLPAFYSRESNFDVNFSYSHFNSYASSSNTLLRFDPSLNLNKWKLKMKS